MLCLVDNPGRPVFMKGNQVGVDMGERSYIGGNGEGRERKLQSGVMYEWRIKEKNYIKIKINDSSNNKVFAFLMH